MARFTGRTISFTKEGNTYVCDPISKLTKSDITNLGIPGEIPDVILEYEDVEHFPVEGEAGKLYIDVSENIGYRWDTTNDEYVPISSAGGNSVLVRVPFEIDIEDWDLVSEVYQANFVHSAVGNNSVEVIQYDNSIAEYLTSNVLDVLKVPGSHALVFKTATIPTGTISGDILIFSNLNDSTSLTVVDGEKDAILSLFSIKQGKLCMKFYKEVDNE